MNKQAVPKHQRPMLDRRLRPRRTPRTTSNLFMDCPRLESSLCSDEVPAIAGKLGASTSESAWLSAVFNLEGFGGMEFNRRYSALRVVANQLRRLRALAGVPQTPFSLPLSA